jgi:hypothetical protein
VPLSTPGPQADRGKTAGRRRHRGAVQRQMLLFSAPLRHSLLRCGAFAVPLGHLWRAKLTTTKGVEGENLVAPLLRLYYAFGSNLAASLRRVWQHGGSQQLQRQPDVFGLSPRAKYRPFCEKAGGRIAQDLLLFPTRYSPLRAILTESTLHRGKAPCWQWSLVCALGFIYVIIGDILSLWHCLQP